MRWPSALLLLAALAAVARADDAPDDRVARLKAAERTALLVSVRDREVRARLAARVRAYVKAERAGLARLWFEPGARMDFLARRAAMTHLLRRDLRELAVMEAEQQAAATAREHLHGELAAAEPSPPAPGSLVRPIARGRVRTGFGVRRHRESRADMSARGVELACRPGDPVLAVAAGSVRWTGSLSRGAATAVLIDHGDFLSVLVGFGRVRVATGQPVAAGQVLGDAAGDELHVEIRLRSGAFGKPVDPAPLLAR
jgi:murein hydrolase activator